MAHPASGYRLKDGTKVPGVTTIIGRFKESGGLLFWAFEQGKCCERGEITGLYDKRDAAADSGTLAHSMVEAYINDAELPDLSKYPEDIASSAKQGFENYVRWQTDNRITVIHQEMQLVSEAHVFGGCPDAIGVDSHGKTCLIDWKTSSSGPYIDWLLQLSAYKILWEENHPDKPITGGFHLLRFSKENADFHHHFWQDLSEAERQFLLLREAYEIDKKLKKRL
jgi:hypothetical protein